MLYIDPFFPELTSSPRILEQSTSKSRAYHDPDY